MKMKQALFAMMSVGCLFALCSIFGLGAPEGAGAGTGGAEEATIIALRKELVRVQREFEDMKPVHVRGNAQFDEVLDQQSQLKKLVLDIKGQLKKVQERNLVIKDYIAGIKKTVPALPTTPNGLCSVLKDTDYSDRPGSSGLDVRSAATQDGCCKLCSDNRLVCAPPPPI